MSLARIRPTLSSKSKGQSMVEMALVLPILLLLVLGVFELGRAVFIFSAVNNASREAARYGASTGASGGGVPRYLDCNSIRQQARDTAFLSGLTAGDVEIAYDRPNGSGGMTIYGTCVGSTAVFTSGGSIEPSDIQLGDRVLVTVTRDIAPISGFIPLPDFSPTFVTARTILKQITIGPVECGDGVDNDGDGSTDLNDPGCSGPDDTTEAFCYRLSVVAAPADGGTMSTNPGTNCSNRYVEGTTVHLEAIAADRYTFMQWSGSHNTTDNPTSILMDSDKDIIAEFRPLMADLDVDKFDSVDPVGVEETYTYSIEVSNPITDDARSVLITDTLPVGVTFQNWTHSSGGDNPNCTPSAGTVICELDRLPSGQTAVFNLEVQAPSSPGTITNTVTATAFEFDPDLSDNSDVETTEVIPITDLWLFGIEDLPDPVNAAALYDYTVTVANNGPSPATGVVVTDTLPSGVSFVSSADGCTASGSTVTCPITGTLGAGTMTSVAMTVRAPNDAPEPNPVVVNTAEVRGNETDRNLANNSLTEETTVHNRADLVIGKTGPATAARDQEFDYSLTVTNNGPSTAEAVTVSDTLPASFNAVSYSTTAPGGSCNITTNPVTCDLGDMLSGESHTIVLTVTPTQEGSFDNIAEASSTTTDHLSGNDTDSVTTSIEADVGLTISKSAPANADEGDSFNYTISVTNNGPSNANNVTVTDSLPGGVSFVSASAGCSHNSGEVICTHSQLVATLSTEFTITVTPNTTGDVTNRATVTSDEDTTGVSASATTNVDPNLDLSLTKSGPSRAEVGVPFDYTLNVANSGPSTATSVEVHDSLPAGVDYDSVTTPVGWTCDYDATAHELVCTTPEFAGGAEAIITITVTPTAETAGNNVINEATVTAAESNFDTNGVNDTGNENTPVE